MKIKEVISAGALLLSVTSYLPAAGAVPEDGGVYVIADVTWPDMYAYVYDESSGTAIANHEWPGEQMTKDDETGFWYYRVPEHLHNGQAIFSSTRNSNPRYPANQQPGLPINGKSMIYSPVNNSWEEYVYSVPEPGDDITWSLHFHNTENWENIHVHIHGGGIDMEGELESFLNSVIFDYEFTAPENVALTCSFYTLSDGEIQSSTPLFTAKTGHVYTISGDKGLKSEYDPNNVLPEIEYWLEPAVPTAKDVARLYFNRAYNTTGKLRYSDTIHVHAGLIKQGAADSDWTGAPDWFAPDEKFFMKQDEKRPDLFYIDFEPSIAEWFGVDKDQSYSKLALIFRDGDKTQHANDQFLPLRVTLPAGEGLGAVLDYEVDDTDRVIINSEKGKIYLTPWSKDIVKVFTLLNSDEGREERRTISVISDEEKETYEIDRAFFNINEDDRTIRFSIPEGVAVEINKSTSILSFFNQGDSSTPALEELGGLSNKRGNVTVTFQGMNDRAFYGGGYNGNLINWEGQTMLMDNNQQGNWGQGASLARNICIPFYLSTEGYGVYFDDHYEGARIIPSQYGSSYSSRSQDPISYYFVGGGDMEKVMQNYTTLTGRQALPPFWALGYITSKFSFKSRQEAENAVKSTKDINIPIDGIVFDIHWQTGDVGQGTSGMGRIDWERSAYPDPEEMMKGLREQNVHTIAITEPYFTTRSGNYDYLRDNGYLADEDVSNMGWLESSKVGLLDITNPDAARWYQELYKARTKEGIESWWLDLGEPERHDADSRYKEGTKEQVHNEYGLLWNAAAYSAIKEAQSDKRFITMPRAGTSGMQRYNAFPWTGDIARSWAGLKAQVPALVSGAMSGISYLGSDIGGFIDEEVGTIPNLYRRWVQLGVFYPSMRTHSQKYPEVFLPQYEQIRDDVRDAINLRYAYLPYLYSQSYAYTRYGTPIARPANYMDENKSRLKNEIGAYYWGPDMYVAPVLDESTVKTVNFPEGDWLDMNDFTTVYRGGSKVEYNAPTNVIPHFMRRGSFITRYRQDTFTSTAEIKENELIVDYFATKSVTADGSVLYEDNHEDVNSISDGSYLLTTFSGSLLGEGENKQLAIDIDYEGNGWEGMPEHRDIIIRIHDFPLSTDEEGLSAESIRLESLESEPEEPEIEEPENGDEQEETEEPENSEEAPARMKGKGILTTTPFVKVNNVSDLTVMEGHSFYHDTEGGHFYLRIPSVKAHTPFTLTMGNPEDTSGIEENITGGMTLACGNGVITYSAPAGVKDLKLILYSVMGAEAERHVSLAADGYASQIRLSVPSGVYIASLTGRDSTGKKVSKTIKIMK